MKWHVVWIERHEEFIDATGEDELAGSLHVRRKLAERGIQQDQITACYLFSGKPRRP